MVCCDCLSHWDLGSKPNVGNSKLFPVNNMADAGDAADDDEFVCFAMNIQNV